MASEHEPVYRLCAHELVQITRYVAGYARNQNEVPAWLERALSVFAITPEPQPDAVTEAAVRADVLRRVIASLEWNLPPEHEGYHGLGSDYCGADCANRASAEALVDDVRRLLAATEVQG